VKAHAVGLEDPPVRLAAAKQLVQLLVDSVPFCLMENMNHWERWGNSDFSDDLGECANLEDLAQLFCGFLAICKPGVSEGKLGRSACITREWRSTDPSWAD
tara:strand:- start:34 stop:336 length:303 start_codon:yes stop_codon:yes gene_type:complete